LGEFARMVEGRELPRPANDTFWSVDGTDAYVVVRWNVESNDAVNPLPRGLSGVILASQQGNPAWFVQGLSDTVAQRLSPRLPRVDRLEKVSNTISRQMAEPHDFIEGRVPADVAAAAAVDFVQSMMRQGRKFPQLVERLATDAAFSKQVESVYGNTLDELLSQWWDGFEPTTRRRR